MILKEKIVWLTGASSGIGEALFHELIKEDCLVALTARRAEMLEELAAPYLKEDKKVLVLPGDVSDSQQMKSIAEKIENEWGPIDIGIFNAGWWKALSAKKFESANFETTMQVNFMGVVYGVEAILPKMIERNSGQIVGVASVAGFRGLPLAASYGSSKAALIYFLDAMRFDLKRYKIGVTCVNPGFIETPMTSVNKFPMPFLKTKEFAAKKIVAGLKKGKDEITFPWQMKFVMKFLKVIPTPLYNLLVSPSSKKSD